MPETIRLREVQVTITQPGQRTQSLVIVTMLLDAEEYTKADLAELYHRRWLVWELCVAATAARLIAAHLADLVLHCVGNRPGRVEPRAIKRRPKPHKLLKLPRKQARQAILAGAADAQS